MSSNFLSLPREIRDQIYELGLLHQEPIDCLRGYDAWKIRPYLTTELFRVNKTVGLEASSLFYSQNHFDLSWGTSEEVTSFLKQIGQKNADFIQHVHVNFPEILCLEPGKVILDSVSVSIIASIQSSCANVTTLTTSSYSTGAMAAILGEQDNPKVVTDALELVNTHFRAFSSLEKIITEMYERDLSDKLRNEMERYRWIISILQYVEEEVEDDRDMLWDDRDVSDGYDDGVDDDYDIDNDSDFWRRQAD